MTDHDHLTEPSSPPPPYAGLEEELILRDHLAASRTALANERTLLAYVRTALAVFAGGVTLVHFFDSIWLEVVGWTFVPIGVVIMIEGVVRYRRMQKQIHLMQNGGG